jgi:transcription factor IIIB 90 kDa subunit
VITAEIGFSELGNGATVVQGTLLENDRTRLAPRGGGRIWGSESREQTIQKADLRTRSLAVAMGLHAGHVEQAMRYFKLALNQKFNQGRRSQYVVASCLYVACRMSKTSHMLIDFSDKLKINLFTLGATFLKLNRILDVKLPIIEPEIYIRRFARELGFGVETDTVAKDATRLVQRMDRDWLSSGRRPAGLCGAALFISSRMNNFRRSVREIVYFVKVSDATVKKRYSLATRLLTFRIEEFSSLPSAKLTVEEFREIWFQNASDPPAFAAPRSVPAIGNGEGEQEEELSSDPQNVVPSEMNVLSQTTEIEAEAQSDFLEGLVADRALEDEINRHLDNEEFQQALLHSNGINLSIPVLTVESDPTSNVPEDEGNLSDLDDDEEVSGAIISESSEHFILRAKLWMETNRDYLREQRGTIF